MQQHPARSRRLTNSRAVIVAAVLSMVLVACGSDGPGPGSSADSREAPSGSTVRMKLIAFKPSALAIKTGTTITWEQSDPGMHTVTSGTVESGAATVMVHPDGKFASGELATGDDFEFTFAEPGTYPYFCEIHPATMRGEITVR